MNICIAGDTCFFGEVLEQDPAKELIRIQSFQNADLRIVNLEQAVSGNLFTEDKYTIYSNESCIPYLQALKIDIASLANNHIHDKGAEGIRETLHILKENHILTCGAGKDIYEARRPVKAGEDLYLLSFCDYGRPYLRNVSCASEATPGMNPYSLQNVLDALDKLPKGAKAMIYVHWCVEYCWMVPYYYISDARKILAHSNTVALIGTHPHIPLGWLKSGGKYAFFSLGNFLFPNFGVEPPHHFFHADAGERGRLPVMRILCPVKRRTYKKWYPINRISILLCYDTDLERLAWEYTMQEDDLPQVSGLSGKRKKLIHTWLRFLSGLYRLPKVFYIPLYFFNLYSLYGIRRIKRMVLGYF